MNDTKKNDPRPLFEDSTVLMGSQHDEFRTKLGWAVNHVIRYRTQLATISAPLKEAVKHHQKMAEALAESIKFKSTLPMQQEFGPDWMDELERMQALYSGHEDKIHDAHKRLADALQGDR